MGECCDAAGVPTPGAKMSTHGPQLERRQRPPPWAKKENPPAGIPPINTAGECAGSGVGKHGTGGQGSPLGTAAMVAHCVCIFASIVITFSSNQPDRYVCAANRCSCKGSETHAPTRTHAL